MKDRGYSFSFDERVYYNQECSDLLYEFIEDHRREIEDYFDRSVLDRKLKEKTLAHQDLRKILQWLGRKMI